MIMCFFKKIGFVLTLATLASSSTIYASQSSSFSSSSSSSSSSHSTIPCHAIDLAEASIHQIISDLNVAILTIIAGFNPNLVNAYNADILIASQNLQKALQKLGGNHSADVGSAFNTYALVAEDLAAENGSIVDLFSASSNLSAAFVALNPSIKPTKINNLLSELNTAIVNLVITYNTGDSVAAVAANNQAHAVVDKLVNYVIRTLVKNNFHKGKKNCCVLNS